jgi:transposase InsO family protein
MIDPAETLRARVTWVKHYAQTQDAGLTCRRCGISRPTLRKWWRRYQQSGEAGLVSLSRRRHHLPPSKVKSTDTEAVLALRTQRKLGPKGIQNELQRLHQRQFSTATIWVILAQEGISQSVRPHRKPKLPKRYNRPVPGDRVQIDNCKITKGLYQFTAIDDCTRLRVLRLYDGRTAKNATSFVEEIRTAFPFPIQRIQTDRGPEFIADEFQKVLREKQIKFRPIRARSPHLNGKVERSQQTDRLEFWATIDKSERSLVASASALASWERHYNEGRSHSSLSGKTPNEWYQERASLVPTFEAVTQQFDVSREKWHTNWPFAWTYTPEKGFFLKRCR